MSTSISAPADLPDGRNNRVGIDRLALAAVLAYGGVALLQWFQAATLAVAPGVTGQHYAHWLRDGTLALPFVAAAVYIATRRMSSLVSAQPNLAVIFLYATTMGAGALLRQFFPESAYTDGMLEMAGSGQFAQVSVMSALSDLIVIATVAALYALLVDRALYRLNALLTNFPTNLPMARPWVRVACVLLVLFALVPAFGLGDERPAIAQTTFPEHTIHPKINLLLVAKVLDDGWWGFVAPAYGALGIRPTIEMTEGETLNITLRNEFHKDVSLHVHGVQYGQDSDGTRHSNSTVKPGEERVYQWRAVPGTAGYWHYHDHVVGDNEGTVGIQNGFYGGLVVRRATDPKPSKTFMVVMHNLTINGRQYPNTPTFTARQGELVEFIVVNYMDNLHTFHLHGHRWLTPPAPGNPAATLAPYAPGGREDNHILAPGDSFGFMTIAGDGVGPGMWMYHCHVQSHSGLMMGFFNVLPPAPKSK